MKSTANLAAAIGGHKPPLPLFFPSFILAFCILNSPFPFKIETILHEPILTYSGLFGPIMAIFDPSIFSAIRIPYSSQFFRSSQVKASSIKSSLVKYF